MWGLLRGSFKAGGREYGGGLRGSFRRRCEDMGVVMPQFWAGVSGYWGCYVVVLGREAEGMGVFMLQF